MTEITDQVIDFYNALFEKVFFQPFSGRISERRRRDAVKFQVLEAAGAASHSLERFFASQKLTAPQVKVANAYQGKISPEFSARLAGLKPKQKLHAIIVLRI